jgi:hypothetical protein
VGWLKRALQNKQDNMNTSRDRINDFSMLGASEPQVIIRFLMVDVTSPLHSLTGISRSYGSLGVTPVQADSITTNIRKNPTFSRQLANPNHLKRMSAKGRTAIPINAETAPMVNP